MYPYVLNFFMQWMSEEYQLSSTGCAIVAGAGWFAILPLPQSSGPYYFIASCTRLSRSPYAGPYSFDAHS